MKTRTFLAAEISEEVRKRLLDMIRNFGIDKGVKWVRGENMHVTIYFFGNVENEILRVLREVIAKSVETLNGFEIDIRGIGAFPNLNRPRVIWAGVMDSTETLKVIYNEVYKRIIKRKLNKSGVQVESREYKPHLTLGRVKGVIDASGIEKLSQCIDYNFGRCYIDKVVLFSSELHRDGPIYTPLQEFKLKS